MKNKPSVVNDKFITLIERSGDFLEDAVGGGAQTKWFRLVIVLNDVSLERFNEVLDRAEATSADGLGGDFREPSLYLVDPGTTRRSKMQLVGTQIPCFFSN